jgi:hypothetical protein
VPKRLYGPALALRRSDGCDAGRTYTPSDASTTPSGSAGDHKGSLAPTGVAPVRCKGVPGLLVCSEGGFFGVALAPVMAALGVVWRSSVGPCLI